MTSMISSNIDVTQKGMYEIIVFTLVYNHINLHSDPHNIHSATPKQCFLLYLVLLSEMCLQLELLRVQLAL